MTPICWNQEARSVNICEGEVSKRAETERREGREIETTTASYCNGSGSLPLFFGDWATIEFNTVMRWVDECWAIKMLSAVVTHPEQLKQSARVILALSPSFFIWVNPLPGTSDVISFAIVGFDVAVAVEEDGSDCNKPARGSRSVPEVIETFVLELDFVVCMSGRTQFCAGVR